MSKKQPKLTRWFPESVKPVHYGFYQTQQPDGAIYYNEWSPRGWHWGYSDSPRKSPHKDRLPQRLLKSWRGLAVKP